MFYAFFAKTNITQTETFMKQCIMEANSETNLEKDALRLTILCDSCKQDDNYVDTEHQKTILLILC